MVLNGKVSAELEVRSSADIFDDLFGTRPHHLSNIIPKHIQGCELLEGEFGKTGSVINWNYTVDGKRCVSKEMVDSIDLEKKTLTLRVIDGDLMHDFKTFVLHIQIVPAAEEGGCDTVKWVIEYERIDEDAAFPTQILDFIFKITKDIETHHRDCA